MGNSFEAVRKFLGHYGIPFAPVHMFSRNIYNPLFLTLYCKTYQGDEVDLPILYERLLEKANEKFTKVIEKADYDPSYNIVTMYNGVLVLRAVESYIKENESNVTGRKKLVLIHGNRFLLHLALREIKVWIILIINIWLKKN